MPEAGPPTRTGHQLAVAWGLVRHARALLADADEFLVAELGDVEYLFETIPGLAPGHVEVSGLDARQAMVESERLLRRAGGEVPLVLWAAFRAVQEAVS